MDELIETYHQALEGYSGSYQFQFDELGELLELHKDDAYLHYADIDESMVFLEKIPDFLPFYVNELCQNIDTWDMMIELREKFYYICEDMAAVNGAYLEPFDSGEGISPYRESMNRCRDLEEDEE